ncbi:MAG: YCF48-related protein [Cytophagales bacterium]
MNRSFLYIKFCCFVVLMCVCISCKKVKTSAEPAEKQVYVNLLHSGTTENLRAIHFTNTSTGFALGAAGSLYKTVNEGLTWTKSTPVVQDTSKTTIDTNMVYTNMTFVDETNGWIIGTYNAKATATATSATARKTALLKTTNGGSTWTNMNFDTEIKTFQSVAFYDAFNGYVVGNSGLIYRTFDGGKTWIKQNSGVTRTLKDIAIVSANTAYVVGGYGTLLKTTNGGATWEKLIVPAERAFATAKYSTTTNELFITGGGEGGLSTNADKAFVLKLNSDGSFTDLTNKYYAVFYFYGLAVNNFGKNLWTVGHLGQIFRSTDGGSTWSEELSKSQREETLYDAFFVSDAVGYFVGNGGVILKVDLNKE